MIAILIQQLERLAYLLAIWTSAAMPHGLVL